jgi:uncharacterized protein (TIGR02588 family)
MSALGWRRDTPSHLPLGLGVVALLLGLAGFRLLGGAQSPRDVVDDVVEEARGLTGEGRRSAAQWTGLGISVAVVLAVVGLIVFQELTGGDRPPTIEVLPNMEALRSDADAHYLPVEIANRGDLTAENVRVRLSLPSGEATELEIQFLAGGDSAEGTAVFSEDPSSGLTVDVLGFLEP